MDRTELRKAVKSRRKAMRKGEILRFSRKIARALMANKEVENASTVLCYYPIKGEPDLRKFMEKLRKKGKNVCLPMVEGDTMRAVVWEGGELEKVPPGVMQPRCGKTPDKIDVVIVPALAFDVKGNRLGFGGGYYDKFLCECGARKIGAAFDEFIVQELAAEPWDIPVDAVVTNKRFFDFTRCEK